MSVVSKETVGELQILVACVFFSLAFVGQRYAMTQFAIGPFTFNAIRYMVSLLTLQLFKPILLKYSKIDGIDENPDDEYVTRNGGSKSLLYWIMVAGLSNFGGSMLQQYSLVSLETAKVAFITGSYVVIIPFVEWLWPMVFGFSPECVSPKIWIGVFMSFIGLYYLSGCGDAGADCLNTNSAQTIGLICVTASVIFWTINLMMADQASKQVDCLQLTMGEFAVVVVLTTIVAIYFEPKSWSFPFTEITDCGLTIIFVGFCEAVAYVTSTIGQMYVRPSRASIIYSGGEALFASFGAFLYLGETLTYSEIFGGFLMLVAAAVSSTTINDDDDDEEQEDKKNMAGEGDIETTTESKGIAMSKIGVSTVAVNGKTSSVGVTTEYSKLQLHDDGHTQDHHNHHHHKHAVHVNTQPYSYGSTSDSQG